MISAVVIPLVLAAGLQGAVARCGFTAAPVFSAGERAFLDSRDAGSTAGSLRVSLTSAEEVRVLRECLARAGIAAKVELNARVSVQAHTDQWALKNTGAPQEIELSDVDTIPIASVAGEDLGLAGAPPEVPSRRVVVAVVDTGADLTHPAISPYIRRSSLECEALARLNACLSSQPDKQKCRRELGSVDADGNGYALDCNGWNVLGGTGGAGSNDVFDEVGHGTHVAGIIASSGLIGGAATGSAVVLPVKVLGRGPGAVEGETEADVFARGVLYAVRSGAQVINLSLGYAVRDDSELMRRMVALAQSSGILVVAAAGNQSSGTPVYPCRYEGVICVGSFSADGALSHFSNHGDAVDIAAPGHSILSSWPMRLFPARFTERKGYDFKNGTSMAAPFVSALLARLLNLGFTAQDSYARLMLGARPQREPTAMPHLQPARTLAGNVDLARAVLARAEALLLPAVKDPLLVKLDRMRGVGATFELKLGLKNVGLAPAVGARVKLRLEDAPGLSLAADALELGAGPWPVGETRTLELSLRARDGTALADLPGLFALELTVNSEGARERVLHKAIEFVVPIRPQPAEAGAIADPLITESMISGAAFPPAARRTLQALHCLDGSGADDYLVTSQAGPATAYETLRFENGTFTRHPIVELRDPQEKPLALGCLGVTDGFGLVTQNAAAKKFVFRFPGTARAALESSSELAPVNSDFRWLRAADGSFLPAWVALGRLPEADLPRFDPWQPNDPERRNPQAYRLYALGAKGLHALKLPEGYKLLTLLKPTPDELAAGTATALLIRGDGFIVEHALASVTPEKIGAPIPLRFDAYHALAGLTLVPLRDTAGTGFVDASVGGRLRLSLVAENSTVHPLLLTALRPGAELAQVLGLWSGGRAFYRSKYEVYFRDGEGRVAYADPRQYDGVARHVPLLIDGTPALLLGEAQGASLTSEILVPRDGAITRPAIHKTLGLGGCELVDPVQATPAGAATPSRLTYFCGDRLIRVAF